jgi:hypothetical protein
MKDPSTYLAYTTGISPLVKAQNSTGAATPDGTEFIAELIDDLFMGPMQAVLDYAGLTPNGVTEEAGASQFIEAIGKGFAAGPGVGGDWWLDDDPATSGHRALLMQGQGVLRASYPDLDDAVYVGDANNAAVAAGGGSGLSRGAFYHADDAAGLTPNTTGAYLILPDTRGRSGRGKDPSATVDPQGALRFLGDEQNSAIWGHHHEIPGNTVNGGVTVMAGSTASARCVVVGTQPTNGFFATDGGPDYINSAITDGVNGAPNLSSESRGANYLECKYITF